jgi:hypothetical protein
VSEIVGDPDDADVLRDLLTGIVAEAKQRGIPLQGQLTISASSAAHAILQLFFGSTLHAVDDTAVHGYLPFMVRSVGNTRESPFAAPGALFWPLDAY